MIQGEKGLSFNEHATNSSDNNSELMIHERTNVVILPLARVVLCVYVGLIVSIKLEVAEPAPFISLVSFCYFIIMSKCACVFMNRLPYS